jgi:hypothetical protein
MGEKRKEGRKEDAGSDYLVVADVDSRKSMQLIKLRRKLNKSIAGKINRDNLSQLGKTSWKGGDAVLTQVHDLEALEVGNRFREFSKEILFQNQVFQLPAEDMCVNICSHFLSTF